MLDITADDFYLVDGKRFILIKETTREEAEAYIFQNDYEYAWDHWFECRHCGMFSGIELMMEHLDKQHWWLHRPDRVILP